ncbi:ABC transporter ATP-binding protein [Roseibacillus ishigakijimensis]|uniref:ABC transporter ATP-binding protein n=1 Tax=Roseibacillus ishigakijimensis TaxID=454146 RepID=A0A934VHL0_9BACT|nr:ABC transporter ATP-binding protein [Roseibacillus ishigakijimensis]MBK1834078.1 ABC transporter ATP-binding protein [Roseibacillus ishigakijimensis]
MSEPAVIIRDLVKEFPSAIRRQKHRAVDGVSLTIPAGEVYGLIGPNGSGKSTTMKALLGLLSPTSGHCEIFGKNSLKVDSRQDVGYLPENPYFYKHLSGRETLRFYGKLCGMKGVELAERSEELLTLTGLAEAADRRLGGYSKGMLQRIGLAQALIQSPRLLILDEPTAGVDPLGSRQIRDLILDLKSRGITVFLCSHLLEQVQEICDTIGIIHQGKMLKQGPLDELVALQDQTEILLQNASPELLAQIRTLVGQDEQSRLLSASHPRTSLEKLFLESTRH